MNKFKKMTMTAKISVGLALAIILFTIFISVINIGLDPSKIDIYEWGEKIVVNIMLALFMMFAGETSYLGYVTTKDEGKYQYLIIKYNEAKDKVVNKTQYLEQYLELQYDKARKSARYEYLINHGVEDAAKVLKLDIQDIRFLDKPYEKEVNGEKLIFKSHTKKQIEAITFVLEGHVIINKVSKNFYLDKDSNTVNKDTYVEAGDIERQKKKVRFSGRAGRVLSMVIVSFILATVTVNDFIKGEDLQAWMNLMSRLFACVGGYWAGVRNSARVIEIDCRALVIKTTMLTEFFNFLSDKPNYFTLSDEEAYAHKELEEYNSKKVEADVLPYPVQTETSEPLMLGERIKVIDNGN